MGLSINGNDFPTRDIVVPAMKVGALTGSTGLLYGGAIGTLRSANPALFAIAAGIQWSALGLTFSATRSTILHIYYPNPSQKDRLTASTVAGGITGGAIGGLFRGPRNIIPGTIMFTLFGYLGQTAYGALDARHSRQVASDMQAAAEGKKKSAKHFWEWLAEKKWIPMEMISDEDYADTLKEKLLRVDAEIALLDDEVARLRDEERRMKERQGKEPLKPTT